MKKNAVVFFMMAIFALSLSISKPAMAGNYLFYCRNYAQAGAEKNGITPYTLPSFTTIEVVTDNGHFANKVIKDLGGKNHNCMVLENATLSDNEQVLQSGKDWANAYYKVVVVDDKMTVRNADKTAGTFITGKETNFFMKIVEAAVGSK